MMKVTKHALMIVFALLMVLIIFFNPGNTLAENSTISLKSAPANVTEESENLSGSMEVQIWGSDKIPEKSVEAGKKIFIVPYENELNGKLTEDVGYMVNAYPPVKITGIKAGRYWVGITTQFDPLMGENLNPMKMPSFNPLDFYAWDGSEKNMLSTKEGGIIYTAWYSAWVEPQKNAVVTVVRMKKGSDINARLQELPPRSPMYKVSAKPSDDETLKLVNLLQKYGKAFQSQDSILSVQQAEGGSIYHLVAGEKADNLKRSLFGEMPQGDPISFSTSNPNASAREKNGDSTVLPPYESDLNGPNEVRVMNPNKFGVFVGLRKTNSGKNFEVSPGSVSSVFVPDGKYEIYFVYSNQPDALYKGDGFTLERNGIEIKLVKVTGGNYGIKRVN